MENCKHCGKPPRVEKTANGTVAKMYSGMHYECYAIVKGRKPISLNEINLQRSVTNS